MVKHEDSVLDGWWWPPHLPPPAELSLDAGVRAPPLAQSLGAILGHLRSEKTTLGKRCAEDVVGLLGRAGERFLNDLAEPAAAAVAKESGFSGAMSERVVQGMAEGWTREALGSLLFSEFPDPAVLDGFVSDGDRRVRAFGRGVTVHVGAGSVPGVAVTSLIRALIVKSPSFVKPGRGDVALSIAYMAALAEEDPELAAAAVVLYWSGGSPEASESERLLFAAADQIVVYGGADAVTRIRADAPATTHLVVHPHRVGTLVTGPGARVDEVARAVCTFDQRGCVSAQIVLFVGSDAGAASWSESLAGELEELELSLPPGKATVQGHSDVHQLRGAAEIREAADGGIRFRYTPGSAWTILIADLADVVPIGGRTVWIVPCPTPTSLETALETLGPVLQSVGLAGALDAEEIAFQAATAGASRIVSAAEIPFPRANWLHDGQRPLRELVRWAEWW